MLPIVVIIGPTGVGKTKLSIALAKKLDAEIINGDSVAIYKKLDIGSAKPTVEEKKEVLHHLIDIKEPNEEYSVYDYQKDARKTIDDIVNRGKRVIIVGGTGLYIKATLYNYIFTKITINRTYSNLSNEKILEKIKEYDSNISIPINNRNRLVRLLNKYENNEEITHGKDECLYTIYIIGLTAPRDIVYDRINKRVDKMMDEGLLNEVISLKKFYSCSRVLNSAIGYKEFSDYLFHDKSLEDVIYKIKLDSRHYAKRQYTFFTHQFSVKWFHVDYEHFEKTIEEVEEYIEKNKN